VEMARVVHTLFYCLTMFDSLDLTGTTSIAYDVISISQGRYRKLSMHFSISSLR
jgi:hypothetical protein